MLGLSKHHEACVVVAVEAEGRGDRKTAAITLGGRYLDKCQARFDKYGGGG